MSRKITKRMKKEQEEKITNFLAAILLIQENNKKKKEVTPIKLEEITPTKLLEKSDADIDLNRLCNIFDSCAYTNIINIKTSGGEHYMYDMICSNYKDCAEYRRIHINK